MPVKSQDVGAAVVAASHKAVYAARSKAIVFVARSRVADPGTLRRRGAGGRFGRRKRPECGGYSK